MRGDCALIVADESCSCAGVFTLNDVCAAPVQFCKKQLEMKSTSRAILINAGQANAATGVLGDEDAMACAKTVSDVTGVDHSDILLMSTGVIGRRIKMDKFVPAIKALGLTPRTIRCSIHGGCDIHLYDGCCPKNARHRN